MHRTLTIRFGEFKRLTHGNLSSPSLSFSSLVPLVSKVSEARTVDMTSSLMQKLVNGKDQQRDTAVIALKTIVAEVSAPGAVQHLLALLPGKLVAAIDSKV